MRQVIWRGYCKKERKRISIATRSQIKTVKIIQLNEKLKSNPTLLPSEKRCETN
jgi:hypothetical protein